MPIDEEDDPELFEPTSPGATAGEQQLLSILQSVQATQAAMAQIIANQHQQSASSSSSYPDQPLRGKDLARLIKQPSPFRAVTRDDELSGWGQWSWELEQWLVCIDAGFSSDLATIRGRKLPILVSDMSAQMAERSRILYTVLAGLLHDKGR